MLFFSFSKEMPQPHKCHLHFDYHNNQFLYLAYAPPPGPIPNVFLLGFTIHGFNWRVLVGLSSVPLIIILTTWNQLPESPRFDLLHGNMESLRRTLAMVAKENGKPMPKGSVWARYRYVRCHASSGDGYGAYTHTCTHMHTHMHSRTPLTQHLLSPVKLLPSSTRNSRCQID